MQQAKPMNKLKAKFDPKTLEKYLSPAKTMQHSPQNKSIDISPQPCCQDESYARAGETTTQTDSCPEKPAEIAKDAFIPEENHKSNLINGTVRNKPKLNKSVEQYNHGHHGYSSTNDSFQDEQVHAETSETWCRPKVTTVRRIHRSEVDVLCRINGTLNNLLDIQI